MHKQLLLYIITLCILGCNTARTDSNMKQQAQPPLKESSNKILFVCTNVNEVNGKNNGTFLSEIAVPFILFEEANYSIDIVSPNGGEIPIYYKFDTTEIIARALKSEYYQEKITNSYKPKDVNPKDYKALVLPGGYGQFWDVHSNQQINHLIAKVHENNGIIAALGHGTSSLVNVKLSSGDDLVKGKTLTCFPSWFEREVMFEANYGKLLPFDMEVELRNKGANLKPVDKKSRNNSQIIDQENRIVTASSATGGAFIALEIMKMISGENK